MPSDAPYELPSPDEVARMCEIQSWKDHIDDDSREIIEMAGDTIRDLMARCTVLALKLELAEARLCRSHNSR